MYIYNAIFANTEICCGRAYYKMMILLLFLSAISLLFRLSFFSSSYHKPHSFHLPLVLSAAFHNIDPRSVDAGVTEQICQLCDILFHAVKGLGE